MLGGYFIFSITTSSILLIFWNQRLTCFVLKKIIIRKPLVLVILKKPKKTGFVKEHVVINVDFWKKSNFLTIVIIYYKHVLFCFFDNYGYKL